MKTHVFALLIFFACAFQSSAQQSETQSSTHAYTYEEVLARWDQARAFGEARSLPEYSRYLNELYDTNSYSAGFRDGVWIRFYARSEEIFGDITPLVLIGALLGLLLVTQRFWRGPLEQLFGAGDSLRVTDRVPESSRLEEFRAACQGDSLRVADRVPESASSRAGSVPRGVGGWLLFLCIWTTVIWPVLTFAQLHRMTDDWMYVFIVLIGLAIVSGISLWRVNRNGLILVRTFLAIILALNLVSVFAFGSAHPDVVPGALLQSAIPAAWLIYLHQSRRVRATFEHGVEDGK